MLSPQMASPLQKWVQRPFWHLYWDHFKGGPWRHSVWLASLLEEPLVRSHVCLWLQHFTTVLPWSYYRSRVFKPTWQIITSSNNKFNPLPLLKLVSNAIFQGSILYSTRDAPLGLLPRTPQPLPLMVSPPQRYAFLENLSGTFISLVNAGEQTFKECMSEEWPT